MNDSYPARESARIGVCSVCGHQGDVTQPPRSRCTSDRRCDANRAANVRALVQLTAAPKIEAASKGQSADRTARRLCPDERCRAMCVVVDGVLVDARPFNRGRVHAEVCEGARR